MPELATAVGVLALIMDHDQAGATPDKDRMRYKRGDIVEVYGPGMTFWKPPYEPWLFVEVTGVPITVEEAKSRYQQMETVGEFDPDGHLIQTPYRRRVYWVDLDSLPTDNKADLAANRYTLITWNKAKSSVKNKVTGQPEG